LGNYIESPDNALHDDEANFEELNSGSVVSSNLGRALQEIEKLRAELKGQKMTHKEFFDLVKAKEIHGKYYLYQKYENNCKACKGLGIT